MRPAKKSRLFQWYFSGHVKRRIRRHFSAVYVDGLDYLRAPSPLLVFANHSSWWDSLFCFDLFFRTTRRDAYAMMDEASLHRLPMLGWIGGFGVRLGDTEDGTAALRYAADLLSTPRVVVMFPQGREQPSTLRPLGFKPGLARLAALTPHASVLPLALRYEHLRDERPIALISIGAPAALTDAASAEAVMEAQLAHVQSALHDGRYRGWHPHFPPRRAKWVGTQRT